MSGGISEFTFPKATLRKIVKPILNEKRIQPPAIDLLNESAVLFLAFITTIASTKTKIKTIKEEDYKKSIEDIGYKAWLEDIDDMVHARIMEEAEKFAAKKGKTDDQKDEINPHDEIKMDDSDVEVGIENEVDEDIVDDLEIGIDDIKIPNSQSQDMEDIIR
eukprot:NODE_207_length_12890_cov_0.936518.p7 type:complete len:162 gc:universal NODE_207_length_12890_cov_0.936518:8908-8423(-)